MAAGIPPSVGLPRTWPPPRRASRGSPYPAGPGGRSTSGRPRLVRKACEPARSNGSQPPALCPPGTSRTFLFLNPAPPTWNHPDDHPLPAQPGLRLRRVLPAGNPRPLGLTPFPGSQPALPGLARRPPGHLPNLVPTSALPQNDGPSRVETCRPRSWTCSAPAMGGGPTLHTRTSNFIWRWTETAPIAIDKQIRPAPVAPNEILPFAASGLP